MLAETLFIGLLFIASTTAGTTQYFTGTVATQNVVIQPTDTLVEVIDLTVTGDDLAITSASPTLMPGLVIRIINCNIARHLIIGEQDGAGTLEMNFHKANITLERVSVAAWTYFGRSQNGGTSIVRLTNSYLTIRDSTATGSSGFVIGNARDSGSTSSLSFTESVLHMERVTAGNNIYVCLADQLGVTTVTFTRASELHIVDSTAHNILVGNTFEGDSTLNVLHNSRLSIRDSIATSGSIAIGRVTNVPGHPAAAATVSINGSRIDLYRNQMSLGDLAFFYCRDTGSRFFGSIVDSQVFIQENTINTNMPLLQADSNAEMGRWNGPSIPITISSSTFLVQANTVGSIMGLGKTSTDSKSRIEFLRGSLMEISNNVVGSSMQNFYVQTIGSETSVLVSESSLKVDGNTLTTGALLTVSAQNAGVGSFSFYHSAISIDANQISGNSLQTVFAAGAGSTLTTSFIGTSFDAQYNSAQNEVNFGYALSGATTTIAATGSPSTSSYPCRFRFDNNTLHLYSMVFMYANSGSTVTPSFSSGCSISLSGNRVESSLFFGTAYQPSSLMTLTFSQTSVKIVGNNVVKNHLFYGNTNNGGVASLTTVDSTLEISNNNMKGPNNLYYLYGSNSGAASTSTLTSTRSTSVIHNNAAKNILVGYAWDGSPVSMSYIDQSQLNITSNSATENVFFGYSNANGAPLTFSLVDSEIFYSRNSAGTGPLFFMYAIGGGKTTFTASGSSSVTEIADNFSPTSSILIGYANGLSSEVEMTLSDSSEVVVERNIAQTDFLLGYAILGAKSTLNFMRDTKLNVVGNTIRNNFLFGYGASNGHVHMNWLERDSIVIAENTIERNLLFGYSYLSGSTVQMDFRNTAEISIRDNTIKLYHLHIGYARSSTSSVLRFYKAPLTLKKNVLSGPSGAVFFGYARDIAGCTNSMMFSDGSSVLIQENQLMSHLRIGDAYLDGASILTFNSSSHLDVVKNTVGVNLYLSHSFLATSSSTVTFLGGSNASLSQNMVSSAIYVGIGNDAPTNVVGFFDSSSLHVRDSTIGSSLYVGASISGATVAVAFSINSHVLIQGNSMSSSSNADILVMGYATGGNSLVSTTFSHGSRLLVEDNTVSGSGSVLIGYALDPYARSTLTFRDESSLTIRSNTGSVWYHVGLAAGHGTIGNVSFVDSALAIESNTGTNGVVIGQVWKNATGSFRFLGQSPVLVSSNSGPGSIYLGHCYQDGSSSLRVESDLSISSNFLTNTGNIFVGSPRSGCKSFRLRLGATSSASTALKVYENTQVGGIQLFDTASSIFPELSFVGQALISVSNNLISSSSADGGLVVQLEDSVFSQFLPPSATPWSSVGSSLKVNRNTFGGGNTGAKNFYISLGSDVNSVEIDRNTLYSSSTSHLQAVSFTSGSTTADRIVGCNSLLAPANGGSSFWIPVPLGDFLQLSGCTRTLSLTQRDLTATAPQPSTSSGSTSGTTASSTSLPDSGNSLRFFATFSVTPSSSSGSGETAYTPPSTRVEFAQLLAAGLSASLSQYVNPTSEIEVVEFDASLGTAIFHFKGPNSDTLSQHLTNGRVTAADLNLISLVVASNLVTTSSSSTHRHSDHTTSLATSTTDSISSSRVGSTSEGGISTTEGATSPEANALAGGRKGIFSTEDGSMPVAGVLVILVIVGVAIHLIGFAIYKGCVSRRPAVDEDDYTGGNQENGKATTHLKRATTTTTPSKYSQGSTAVVDEEELAVQEI